MRIWAYMLNCYVLMFNWSLMSPQMMVVTCSIMGMNMVHFVETDRNLTSSIHRRLPNFKRMDDSAWRSHLCRLTSWRPCSCFKLPVSRINIRKSFSIALIFQHRLFALAVVHATSSFKLRTASNNRSYIERFSFRFDYFSFRWNFFGLAARSRFLSFTKTLCRSRLSYWFRLSPEQCVRTRSIVSSWVVFRLKLNISCRN